jgi:predicted CXXCH cytochrome family protein
MKKIILISLCMLLVASSAFALIAASKHDLSPGAGHLYTGGVKSSCAYCHAPHHAVSGAPLWNRSTSAATYTLYGSGATLAGTTVNQPGINSQTCLSCHDGTINVGDVINGTDDIPVRAGVLNAGGLIVNTAAGYIGTNLTTTHPIGVVYNSAVTIAGLTNVVNANNQVGGKKWKIYGGGNGVGRVECGSCHDPHNTTAGEVPFLKDTLATICSDCHSNK